MHEEGKHTMVRMLLLPSGRGGAIPDGGREKLSHGLLSAPAIALAVQLRRTLFTAPLLPNRLTGRRSPRSNAFTLALDLGVRARSVWSGGSFRSTGVTIHGLRRGVVGIVVSACKGKEIGFG